LEVSKKEVTSVSDNNQGKKKGLLISEQF
jgi:hypothetical protein